MTHIPSWSTEIHPRKCHGCGESCRTRSNRIGWTWSHRDLCPGCLEFFCQTCSAEHNADPYYTDGDRACGKSYGDWPDVPPALPYASHRYDVPGWKAAFITKHIPFAVMGGYSMHTSGWSLRVFINLEQRKIVCEKAEGGEDVTYLSDPIIYREAIETICEGLHASWILVPTAGMRPTQHCTFSSAHPEGKRGWTPPPAVPDGCENGIMVTFANVAG